MILNPRLVLLIAASLCGPASVKATSVKVGLEASFATPPFLLELIETAAQENASSYFPLLDRIGEGAFAECTTEKELYTTFLSVLRDDGHLAAPEALATFRMALSIHAAAPRVEAHYQYYRRNVAPLLPKAQDAVCPTWAQFDGKQYCNPAMDRAQQDFDGPVERGLLPFERQLGLSAELPVATLYGDINSPAMGLFHKELSERARAGQLNYRFRYRPSERDEEALPLAMSGYGMELALKRTDYIVIDDRNEKEDEAKTQETEKDGEGKEIPLSAEELDDLRPLSASQLLGIGVKAASHVMNAEDKFAALEKMSQDFPKHSYAIARTNVSADFMAEHRLNRKAFLEAGYNVVFINGLQIDSRNMDAFALLNQLRGEREVVHDMRSVGLSAQEAISLLSHRAITESKAAAESPRYDYRDEIEGGNTIIWLNDIEKDKRYATWPVQAAMLLQPTYPGALPTIKRDIHNVIVPLDLADSIDLAEAVETLLVLVKREIPCRFGIVPTLGSAESIKQAKAAYYLLDTYGLGALMAYLQESQASGAKFDATLLKTVAAEKKLRKDKEPLEPSEVLSGEVSSERVSAAQKYLRRLGAGGESPLLFVNGVVHPRNDAWMQLLSQQVSTDTQIIQRQVFEALIPDDAWIAGRFLENAVTHRNALIIPEDEDMEKLVDINKAISVHQTLYDNLPKIGATADLSLETWSHVVVVADLDSASGVKLVDAALQWRDSEPGAELVILHNGIFSPDTNAISSRLFKLLSSKDKLTAEEIRESIATEATGDGLDEMGLTFWQRLQPLTEELGFKAGTNGVVFNGRLISGLSDEDIFDVEAFSQLWAYEQFKRNHPVLAALKDLQLEDRIGSPLALAQVCNKLALAGRSNVPEGIFGNTPLIRMDMFNDWQYNHTAIVTGNSKTASTQIVAAVDPTSQIAQRWIPMLRALSELDGVHMKLFLNPPEMTSELPVKRFYRYLLQSEPSFDNEGKLTRPRATFDGLPKKALLNLGMDVPPAWLVAPRESLHDLDNIKLSSVRGGADVEATYELEHILIEGHSRDVATGKAPRGAQLLLNTGASDTQAADTLIMANLGYFQFKANPGYWSIALKPGRSTDIFRIDNVGLDGYSKEVDSEDASSTDSSRHVALTSFQGLTLFPSLSRNPGRESDDVLGDPTKPGSPADYVAKATNFASGILSGVGLGGGGKKEHAEVNIFSVASGHLYERMLNIMMVSVMRHTSKSVKFWFIDQFLSPSFKKTLPAVAAAYGFEYELVTYKWPHWLRGQSEKQREIWGYKILFLDVLFPLSLDKVIFVDADQIVRTDMHELVRHDLQGAPYGFTPMCDSRTEMEGFRFWKQGYWKTFLKGRPYHISALYVVDLKKFRQIAAGDRLRQQYHQLSADPNSLANLDQDLPNNMMGMLPIHSLPQDWLWCETWCSDEALTTAKTIDLCNNPQTHEPKLDRARRQVPEWTVYDEEVADIIRKFEGEGEGGGVRGGDHVQELEQLESQSAEQERSSSEAGGDTKRDGAETTSIKDEL